eukprot:918811-Amphidinium_carterae.1
MNIGTQPRFQYRFGKSAPRNVDACVEAGLVACKSLTSCILVFQCMRENRLFAEVTVVFWSSPRNRHAAWHNAYTDTEITNYFLQLAQEGVEEDSAVHIRSHHLPTESLELDAGNLLEGLDRLANFFKSPLFDEKYVQSE